MGCVLIAPRPSLDFLGQVPVLEDVEATEEVEESQAEPSLEGRVAAEGALGLGCLGASVVVVVAGVLDIGESAERRGCASDDGKSRDMRGA
jgi:hypothetical protein